VNNRPENHIAAQALKALRLRRQWECGDLTHQEYLAGLNVLQGIPDQAATHSPPAATEAARETGGGKSGQMASEPRSQLTGALEVLQLRRRLENAELTPPECLPQSNAQPDMAHLTVPEPAALPASTPAAAPPLPAAPAIVATQAALERFLAMQSPRGPANLILKGKRRPRNHWLRWLPAAAGGTLVLIALLPLAFHEFTGLSHKSAAPDAALTVPEVLPPNLIVSEAGFVGLAERRRIAGVLQNRSGTAYTNIQLTFSLVGLDGDTVGMATATVGHIGGRETARFETPEVKPKAAELVLHYIETHPPLAGAP